MDIHDIRNSLVALSSSMKDIATSNEKVNAHVSIILNGPVENPEAGIIMKVRTIEWRQKDLEKILESISSRVWWLVGAVVVELLGILGAVAVAKLTGKV